MTTVSTRKQDQQLTDSVGVVVGEEVHPFRLPDPDAIPPGPPIVQHHDIWPALAATAKVAGRLGNEPFELRDAIATFGCRAGTIASDTALVDRLADPPPDLFAGEDHPQLLAHLTRWPKRLGGPSLLAMDDAQWRWIRERLDTHAASELDTLRAAYADTATRVQSLPAC